MQTNSIIELSRSAFSENIDFLNNVFGEDVILSSVVKGNAYGHGIQEFVTMAFQCGIRHFSVFDIAEAKEIRSILKDQMTILVMGHIQDEDMEWAIENEIELFVFDKKRLLNALETAKKLKKKAILHIDVETGMHRTGFEKKELKKIIDFLKKEKEHIVFKGLCTHFAGAESMSNYYRVKKQIRHFEEIHQYFSDHELEPEILHSACSAASMMFPKTRMNLVRIGIMQYGLWPSPEVLITYLNSKKIKIDPLRRVIAWKSFVMNVKKVKMGNFIGYGNSYMAKRDIKIAVVPIGYAHGYSRSLSNQGCVLIHGQRCEVIGTINMNMMTVDVTEIKSVNIDDEVVLIGNQEENSITIASFSDSSNQLNYELLTRISKTIPRKIID